MSPVVSVRWCCDTDQPGARYIQIEGKIYNSLVGQHTLPHQDECIKLLHQFWLQAVQHFEHLNTRLYDPHDAALNPCRFDPAILEIVVRTYEPLASGPSALRPENLSDVLTSATSYPPYQIRLAGYLIAPSDISFSSKEVPKLSHLRSLEADWGLEKSNTGDLQIMQDMEPKVWESEWLESN